MPPGPVFPLVPDGETPYTVERAFYTDVLDALDGSEQRLSLRATPVTSLTFGLFTTDPAEQARLVEALAAAPDRRYRVPFWPHAVEVEASVDPGATTVVCQTAGLSFAAGGEALLLVDEDTWEVVPVSAVADGLLTLGAPAVGAWVALTSLVIPLVPMVLVAPLGIDRESGLTGRLPVTFQAEVPVVGVGIAAPAPITGVPASIATEQEPVSGIVYRFTRVRAIVRDALGTPLLNQPIVWAPVTGNVSVHATEDPMIARVTTAIGAYGAVATISATLGGLSVERGFVIGSDTG